MGPRLFFWPNSPGAMIIQGGTFIPDSRVKITRQMEENHPIRAKNHAISLKGI